MTSVNTNILAQIAENNLNNTQNSLTQAVTQLSSGLKINSAADDPAGQAIAVSLQSQINGQNQAISNANDGISLAQTGESALTQITNNLQTINTLAVQSANGSYTLAQRQSLQQQVTQAISQINAIAQTTQFNGQNLLDGTFGSSNFQVGADAGQTVNVNLSQGVEASQIGQTASEALTVTGAGLSATNLSVQVGTNNSVVIGSAVASANAGVAGNAGYGQAADSAYAAAQAVNNADVSGLTATATNVQSFDVTSAALAGTAGDNVNLTINGTQVFGSSGYTFSAANGNTLTVGDTINAINSVTSTTGVSASLASDGSLQLTAADGSNITVSQSSTGTENILSTTAGAALNTALQGTVTLSASSAIALTGAGAANLQVGTTGGTAATSGTAVGTVDLNTTPPVITTGTNDTLTATIDGAAQTVTLKNTDTTTAALVTDINSQLTGGAKASVDATTGFLTITSGSTGTGSTVVLSGDALTGAASVVGTTPTNTTGAAAVAGTPVTAATNGTIGLSSTGVSDINITTVAGATAAIQTIAAAINQVNALQGQLGAVQNRFTSTIANLTSSTQNATTAQSTVQDADFAAASTQLSRANVLSQAATAMIAQANQQPQQVLKLLQ